MNHDVVLRKPHRHHHSLKTGNVTYVDGVIRPIKTNNKLATSQRKMNIDIVKQQANQEKIPSYLRGTVSSNLKAEHSLQKSKSKNIIQSRSPSTITSSPQMNINRSTSSLRTNDSTISLSSSASKRDLAMRSQKGNSNSKISNSSSFRHLQNSRGNLINRPTKKSLQSSVYKDLPKTPKSNDIDYDQASIVSYSTQDFEITELLRETIPTAFINVDDDSFKLPTQKSSNSSLLNAKIVEKTRRPSPSFSRRFDKSLTSPNLQSIQQKRSSRLSYGYSTPQKVVEETFTSSPSKIKAPTVSLKRSDSSLALDREKKITDSAKSIRLNQSSPGNESSGISVTDVYSKARKTSNPTSLKPPKITIPKKIDANVTVRKKKVKSPSSADMDISFLKEFSFDSGMTHLFEDLNLGFQTEIDTTLEEDSEEKISLTTEENDSLQAKKSENSNLSKSTTMHNFQLKNFDPIESPIQVHQSSGEENFENRHCLSINLDHKFFDSKSASKNFNSTKTSIVSSSSKPSKNSLLDDSSSNSRSNRPFKAVDLKKSVTMQSVAHKSLKAVKGKYAAQREHHKHSKVLQNLSSRSSHNNNRGANKNKVYTANELFDCLSKHKETFKMVESWLNETEQPLSEFEITKPIRAKELFDDKSRSLNIYERGELSRKDKVYYINTIKNEKENVQIHDFKHNFGFDDDRQNYIARIGDHVDYRYEIIQILGKGSFGNVLKCKDHKTNNVVAIKIIKNDMQWSLQAVYEIKVLKALLNNYSNNNGILEYFDHFNFRSHMCIVTETLSVDLFQAIESSNFSGFSFSILMIWANQLFNALNFIHSKKIIHCDLKPENILLVSPNRLDIKLIDFGSACYVNETSYSYIQSRFYRAPEVLIGGRYSTAIDIWSAGCILFELLTGDPLFPGKDENEQLALNVELLGPPKRQTISKLRDELKEKGTIDKIDTNSPHQPYTLIDLSFDKFGNLKPQAMVPNGKKRYTPRSKNLSHLITKSSRLTKLENQFIEVLKNCLNWDPFERIEANDVLEMGFLKYYKENQDKIDNLVYE